VPPLALVGNLSRDVVEGGPPRIGGGTFHGARALRAFGCAPASVVARCAVADRPAYLRRLAALGLPTRVLRGAATTAFAFRYQGDRRIMEVVHEGDSWTPDDVAALPPRAWVHVAPLLRDDFSAETLAALARGRRVSFDGQGLVRARQTGPLQLDADFDEAVLTHLSILKLAEEEADVVLGSVDESTVAALGVPEVLVTYGSRGSVVFADGRATEVGAWPVTRDPTGSGDAFSAAYLAARARGHAPVPAARRATTLVAALLTGRLA
jgi:sugar/nucleoside kinase (ribokinase family)